MPSHTSVWLFEFGIRTSGLGNYINRSTIFALHCVVCPCMPNMMQGVGILNFIMVLNHNARYFPISHATLLGSNVLLIKA